jgi:hypothetical protein
MDYDSRIIYLFIYLLTKGCLFGDVDYMHCTRWNFIDLFISFFLKKFNVNLFVVRRRASNNIKFDHKINKFD